MDPKKLNDIAVGLGATGLTAGQIALMSASPIYRKVALAGLAGLGAYSLGSHIVEKAPIVWDKTKEAVHSVGTGISNGWDKTTDAITGGVKTVGDTIGNAATNAWEGTTDWVDSTMQNLKQFTNNTTTNIKNFFKR
jgi:hypothetical protein